MTEFFLITLISFLKLAPISAFDIKYVFYYSVLLEFIECNYTIISVLFMIV